MTTDILVEELEQLRHELANAKKLLTLQESINHLLEQHIASQDTVIRAAREVVRCSSAGCRDARGPSATFHLANALRKLDHASS
jgi:septal ring factor EnvC (AmiA/AmiB activator)